MLETYYVGAYWLGRRESAAACARRAEDFFRLLASLDSTWTRWFHLGWTRKQSLSRPVDPTAAAFEAHFAQKKHQLPEHGFRFSTWNGEEHGQTTRLSITCGSSSRHSCDVCVLDPPSEGPIFERTVTATVMAEVLRAMAVAWEPDHGFVMSYEYRKLVAPEVQPVVLAGWVTYLSRRRGAVPPLPAPVRVEPVEDLGTLIILTPERFTASNPAHVELAAQVNARLDQAGLLTPMQPWSA